MKSYLLSCFVFLCSINFLSAQICQPDQMYADSSFGVYPSSLESACINQPYWYALTFVIPDSVEIAAGVVTAIESINLESVDGLPAGLVFACNPADCEFIPADGLACAYIYGTATDANDPMDYELILNGTISTSISPFPVTLATVFSFLEIENYVITLEEENSGTCLVLDAEEPLNEQVNIRVSPNPFQLNTTIEITSEINEELQLEVYTMLGERVHSEQITLGFGTNAIEFDGSHLSEGVYFFNFSDGHSSLTQKMIVQR